MKENKDFKINIQVERTPDYVAYSSSLLTYVGEKVREQQEELKNTFANDLIIKEDEDRRSMFQSIQSLRKILFDFYYNNVLDNGNGSYASTQETFTNFLPMVRNIETGREYNYSEVEPVQTTVLAIPKLHEKDELEEWELYHIADRINEQYCKDHNIEFMNFHQYQEYLSYLSSKKKEE